MYIDDLKMLINNMEKILQNDKRWSENGDEFLRHKLKRVAKGSAAPIISYFPIENENIQFNKKNNWSNDNIPKKDIVKLPNQVMNPSTSETVAAKPVTVQPKPVIIQPKPNPVINQPKPNPVIVKQNPVIVKPDPVIVKPEPIEDKTIVKIPELFGNLQNLSNIVNNMNDRMDYISK